MNAFLRSATKLISRHGKSATYNAITEGAYSVEAGSTTNNSTSTSCKMYKNHIVANQYRYPNLVDREVAEFYIIATDLASKPKPKDQIVFNSDTFTVDSCREHMALQEIVMYSVVAYRS